MHTRKVAPVPLLTAAALAAAACTAARAEPKPLWEFGLGAGALGINDFPGSDSEPGDPVPAPYLVYPGKVLTSDQRGLLGMLPDPDGIELQLRVNRTTPVPNDSP